MTKGLLVVIEGSDGSGKATQVELIRKALNCVVFDFPRYKDNIYGQVIERYLKGEFGQVNAYFASLPFAMDRFLAKPEIEKALNKGKLVICNRYTASSKAHMGANLPEDRRKEFMDWLDKVEYEVNSLPKPDLTVFLNVPPEVSQQNITGEKDIHEQNLKHLSEANKIYQDLAKSEPNWVTIECSQNGQMRPSQEIHKKIFEKLNLIF